MGFISHRNLFHFFLVLCTFFLDLGSALDSIKLSQFIQDTETVSSKDGLFKLGFFSPKNSTNRYVGIWYINQDNVIWVANRELPLKDSSGIVTISEDSSLVVLNGSKHVVWSSNVSTTASNSTAQLLDTGNLILQDSNTGEIVWESFQFPSDTFMPNMSLSTNKIIGKKVELKSWKTPSDPSIGSFSASVEPLSAPEVFIWNQTRPYWRSGPWNGRVFLGLPEMYSTSLYVCRIGSEEDGTVHLTVDFPKDSELGLFVLTTQGQIVESNWHNKMQVRKYNNQQGECYVYGFCGTFGVCDSQSSPICSCLRGFEPRNVDEWKRNNWTSGCRRKAPLQCERAKTGVEAGKEDGFLSLPMMKVPDFSQQSSVSEDTCRSQCLQNCSCIAYAYDAGIGCMSWTRNLFDIVKFSKGGVNLYLRVANSELDKKRDKAVIIIVAVNVGTIIVAACAYFLWSWTKRHSGETHSEIQSLIGNAEEVKLNEVPLIDYEEIAIATNNFHSDNMLGKGGFGLVFKGVLEDGEEIAVKRLSNASGQGSEDEANTRRVAGTYGYMSPEYAMKGQYSEKSDVYSFGVLLLEIVSGRKNTSFYDNESSLSLIGFAWKLWNEDDIKPFIDPMLLDTGFENQILRTLLTMFLLLIYKADSKEGAMFMNSKDMEKVSTDKKRDKAAIITVAVIAGTIIDAAYAYFLWAWT
ncbi:hypothetical protein L6164_036522 [Bauhinia variegata]|uniref:Uncharacterized protein n=1 Tax=Bauhinia variegata TaxID=167791 RepID=A0ACB9KHA5_BAUVA|nr:hypothetical protein L6164_036522 [Bauhinia variegata]